MAWPGSGQPWGTMQWISLLVMAWLLDRVPHARRAAWLGWVFGTVSLCATVWWLFISLHTYGGLPTWLAASAVLALCSALSLYWGAAAWLYVTFRERDPGWSWRVLAFGACVMLAELARARWFTGFPWGVGGYAHVDSVLAIAAPWVGVYGMGAISAWLAMAVAARKPSGWWPCWTWRQWASALALSLIIALALPWPAEREASRDQAMHVHLLQGNVPQDQKFQGQRDWALAWYDAAMRSVEQGLVVTPETALPYVQQQLPAGYWQGLVDHFASAERAALIGLPLYDLGVSTNSALGLAGAAPPYRYDKHHLVPFGEFVPPLFQWFTRMMNIPLGEFGRGRVDAPSMAWQGQRLAPMICYEDLFGEELAQRFRDPSQAPTVLVNLSNIAWFGDTVAVDQHLQISRLRALELDRPVIRATNTGATAIIDARGRVTHRFPAYQEGVLQGEVMGREGTMTPYARWAGEYGLAPLWVLALALLWLPGRVRLRMGQRTS
jgi:apolipoprotein N-acyltransferase